MGYCGYVAGMTVDARQSRRMPPAVLAAAVLLGAAGGLAGFGLVALGALKIGDSGGTPELIFGGLFLALTFATVVGLVRRNRGAQIGTVVIGMFAVLGSITQLLAGNPVALLWLAVAAAIMLLVAGPTSSRMWFTR